MRNVVISESIVRSYGLSQLRYSWVSLTTVSSGDVYPEISWFVKVCR